MARLLARLGSFSARRPWLVIVSWLLALVLAGASAALGGVQLAAGFSIPNTATQQVADRLGEEFEGVGGAVGTVVFQSDDTGFSDEQRTAVTAALDEVATFAHVSRVVDPFITADDRAEREQQLADGQQQVDAAVERLEAGAGMMPPEAYDAARAQLDLQQEQLGLARSLVDGASGLVTVSDSGTTAIAAVLFDAAVFDLNPADRNAVSQYLLEADLAGVQVDFSPELINALGGIFGVGEAIGLLIAAIVLVVIFGAILPAVIPIVSSIIGVGIGVAGSLAFSGVVEMASVTPLLGVMLGLAVGIDYSLFIINRHRRQLKSGTDVKESIGLANGTAGTAVVFAGSTVFIALLALNVTGIPFVGVMGTVGAACVLVAVLIAITLTPALLGLLGKRAMSRRAWARVGQASVAADVPRPTPRWRAVVTAIVAIGVLLVIAIPAGTLRLGFAGGSAEPEESTQYRAYSIVADEFGPGRNGGLVVAAEPASPVDSGDDLAVLRLQVEIVEVLMAQAGVAAVAPLEVSESGELLAFQVVPVDGPASVSTEQLVQDIRALAFFDSKENGSVELGVAGQASANIDISAAVAAVMPLYLAVVIGLSILIMIVVFRSLLVPLIATGGFLLSFLAALGAVTAVFQWGWLGDVFGVHEPGPVLNFAPIMLVGVLFGLAMDYQLFIASGMREAFVHGMPARSAVVAGVRAGRAVVIAAAIIMIAVFGGFVFSELAMIRPIGFGLAVGVLFDAFIVRLLLMPALMTLLGRSAWWMPRWLDRIVPNVDVEGASLERR